MAQIVLSQVGAVAGAALLPSGLTVFGQTIAGAAIGRAIGSVAGRAIDASLLPASEGPRVKSLQVMESREGAGLPTVYGRMRVGGQVIWASRFREKRKERSAGKGGPKIADFTYSVSFAVALCQGPITRVDRIWANGETMALAGVNWRLYRGDEAQEADPLIEAIEGAGNAPAYRGAAYIVFEDLPLETFGNRLPQLSFEVVRAGEDRPDSLRNLVQGVNIIPASGEFVYATQVVRERRFPGIERALNMNNGEGRADFTISVDQLRSDLPEATSAALTVAWFGDDLRAGECRVMPGIETRDRETVPYGWSVDGTGRGSAHQISGDGEQVNYGGTPADRAVLEGIAALKLAGVAVMLSPFLLMDVPPGNGLSDPYGAAEQAAFPWRGRITVSSDGTAAARAEIDDFVGVDGAFGFRHFILHHARLAVEAGGVDAILIGSEMVGLTRVRDGAGAFPFAEALVVIAAEVRAIVGPTVKISYAADWTEYGAYVPGDGSGDVLFPLDDLWASPDVDFVGVDWYPPAGDWRDGDLHLDALAGFEAADEAAYLLANMAGGEAFDWYYADQGDRDAQVRTPIVDTAFGEDWVFRAKDLNGWWGASHRARPGGVRDVTPTAWTSGMKPVRLIEIGFPAVDRGGNAPNLFFDPKSAESALPPYSSGARDDLYQRRALSAALAFWQGQAAVEAALVWAWDGRPWPHYPVREDVWTDGPNWQFGHWLNGRTGLIELSEVVDDLALRAGISVDVSALEGFVEGFAIDGITDLRGGLAPLEAAFGLVCVELEGALVFRHVGRGAVAVFDEAGLIEDSLNWTRTLLDKLPGRLVLTYVSGTGAYEPAAAEARLDAGDHDYAIRLNMPLVMGEGRARDLAAGLLEQAVAATAGVIATGPDGLALEPGDRVQVSDGAIWQVAGIGDEGLRRDVQLSPETDGPGPARTGEPGGAGDAATVSAAPELFVIDGPVLPGRAGGQPLAAVAADPWPGGVRVSAGPDMATLTERLVVEAAADIGILRTDLPAGPLGRWDEAAVLEVEMPGAELASRSRLAVLNGGGLLLVQGAAGWELLAYREAELVGEDRWRLSGLLRGLSGSPYAGAVSGAVVIVVDERVFDAPLVGDETGLSLLWQAGEADPVAAVFDDLAGLPWRVGHLRATSVVDGWQVSWTRRGAAIPESWSLPEASNTGRFRLEALSGGVVTETAETEVGFASVLSGADSVRVAQIGDDGRVGAWASIPLQAA